MESAAAAADNIGRYGRRVIQMLWDPEPSNDVALNAPVWCLGRSYALAPSVSAPPHAAVPSLASHPAATPAVSAAPTPVSSAPDAPLHDDSVLLPPSLSTSSHDLTPPDSISGSFVSSAAAGDHVAPQDGGGWPAGFLDDFEARLWMTYRSDFPRISRSSDPRASSALSLSMRLKAQLGDQSGFPSDSGWGCMIRSAQSLLANALAMLRLGRSWRRSMGNSAEREILKLFADDPRAPYSIHNFVQHGELACGKYPGEWFGPSAAARCIGALVAAHDPTLGVYSTGDFPDVYDNAFMQVAKPDGPAFRPTLILIGTRLGIDKINPVYSQAIMSATQMPQSVGIAGGRPRSSHYFVGSQLGGPSSDIPHLFYLDPHQTQPALPYHDDASHYTAAEVDTCHTRRLRRIPIREMDPSMLVSFLIRDERDWAEWKEAIGQVQGKRIITVSSSDPSRSTSAERAAAIDEVQALSDDELDVGETEVDDGDTVVVG